MSELTNDPDLGRRARALLRDHHPVAAVAAVDPDGVRMTCWGTELDADYELGSLSKGITGLLYAEALQHGEVEATTTLAACLPLEGTAVGEATLAALAIHRSGLRALPSSRSLLRTAYHAWRHGSNPYAGTLDELLAQARTTRPGPPRPRYSNLGFQLLGHALAARAGTTYRELVRTRIAAPLGLTTMDVPAADDELRPQALEGQSRSGRPRPPWLGEALGPAGGIRASIADLGTLVAALLDGSAPGIDALDPVAPLSGKAHIGAGWITIAIDGHPITWHNGGTGGFRSWAGLDRRTGTGIAVLSATHRNVDPAGFALLGQLSGTIGEVGGDADQQPDA